MDATPNLDLLTCPAVHGSYDELRENGVLRPHWQHLQATLQRMSPSGFAQRYDQARWLIRENGVTYNVYRDEKGLDRPWQLDLLPFMFSAKEWDRVARGVAQRARLIDQVISDAYGHGRLVRDGHLDPSMVFAHPAFLRPCHGINPVTGKWLHFYAADLIRGPNGAWRVLSDRTQAPAGAGYALENRIVLSRALSDSYRSCSVKRLASFFITLRQTLAFLASKMKTRRENPRIVLLSPGPYNETYFEHAYLARYLGYTLVEGGDLTVRDDQVYLKTLGGLHRVDVILRRLDDDFSDPLELRNDSTLGVAGLVAAARAGNVLVANALGSAFGENAALMTALPRVSRAFNAEDLLLESIETIWGGNNPDELRRRFDELIIRPAFGDVRMAAKRGAEIEGEERQRLMQRLITAPHTLVGQMPPTPSSTPVWHDGAFEMRSLVLRVFAVAQGDGYAVMPGGLARIADDNQPWAVSFQRGGGSKDVWVEADGPVAPVTLLRPTGAAVEFKRGGVDLPSRVADNLFWFGRYGARAEDRARVLRAGLTRLAGDQEQAVDAGMDTVLRVLKQQGVLRKPKGEPLTVEAQLLDLIFSDSDQYSLLAIVRRLHYSAFASRDRLSNDTWRIINHLEQDLNVDPKPTSAIDVLPLLDRLIVDLAALAGMTSENTTRGPGWRFLDLGRRLERASFCGELILASLVPTVDDNVLDTVLEIADCSITYRSRYLMSLQVAPVLDLILCDATNPRAMIFQLERILEHVTHLPRAHEHALPTAPERLALGAHTWIRLVDPQELSREDEEGERSHLGHVVEHLSSDLGLLSDAIAKQYLIHVAAIRQPAVGPGEVQ
jgi:uncharacterized circularly permuted ATP-grasp superfamily protein/uncharacterized alpha-E superfamily protein